ncbi:hypothetical protein F0562_023080 [Nyssa sinensis]|uniref:Uncharacterized protein n=1 Tax=Nyssa sinensis TaxID=561372 RepID=A0A5J5BH29_9ASTE|nr:hypothetical protein F0562_023080 [Nyssa sinensis]
MQGLPKLDHYLTCMNSPNPYYNLTDTGWVYGVNVNSFEQMCPYSPLACHSLELKALDFPYFRGSCEQYSLSGRKLSFWSFALNSPTSLYFRRNGRTDWSSFF